MGWRAAIDVTVTGLGYELVEVERAPRGLLRVTIDRIPGRSYGLHQAPQVASDDASQALQDAAAFTPDTSEFVTVEDCEQVTRQLQYVLQVEGLDYARLEVSSPGLDRPLRNEGDFDRYSGAEVSIALKVPFEGRKSWQGTLGRADGGDWELVFNTGTEKKPVERVLGFKMDEVREARLVPVVDFKGRKGGERADAGDRPGVLQGGQADGAPETAHRSGIDGG